MVQINWPLKKGITMATISSKGKTKVVTNNGKLQFNLNDNRLLFFDGVKYRFVIGDKSATETKVLLSKEDENVLDA